MCIRDSKKGLLDEEIVELIEERPMAMEAAAD